MATRFIKSAAQLNAEELLSRSTPEAKLAAEAALSFSKPPPAIVQTSVESRVKQLKERFSVALTSVSVNRKVIYEIVIDLKEHFQEYGFKSPRAAIEIVCNRSKSWANEFCAQIESEAEIDKVTTSLVGSPDSDHRKEEVSLKRVEKSREEKEEEEAPRVHSADEKPERNGTPNRPPIDKSGHVIPQAILGVIERRGEVTAMAHCASKLKCLMESLQGSKDALFAHVIGSGQVQTFMNAANAMHHAISECLPEVVCPQCEGKSRECGYCYGSGWISEVRWNREWVKSNDRIKGVEVAARARNKEKYA